MLNRQCPLRGRFLSSPPSPTDEGDMGIELVVVDHHEPRASSEGKENYFIPTATDKDMFMGMVSEYLRMPYDRVFADKNPDGSIASAIYGLSAETRPDITCMRGSLDSASLKRLERQGVKRVLALGWDEVYSTDVSAAERVVVLNPLFSELPSTLCTTHIVYEAVRQFIGSESADTALALAAIGIVSDYCTGSALGLFKEIAYEYPEYFKDVLQLLRKGELDQYSVFGTRFKELSEMVWSPYILNGSEGSEKMINAIIDNGTFGVGGMLRGSRNPAVVYMRGGVFRSHCRHGLAVHRLRAARDEIRRHRAEVLQHGRRQVRGFHRHGARPRGGRHEVLHQEAQIRYRPRRHAR